MHSRLRILLVGLLLGCEASDGSPGRGEGALYEGYRTALAHVETASETTAGPGEVRRAGGVVLRAAGTKRAGAEGQGLHPDSASPGRFHETLAVDADGDRVGYAYRHDRYDGTRERLREVYGPGDRRVIYVLDQGFAIHLVSPEHRAARRTTAELLSAPKGIEVPEPQRVEPEADATAGARVREVAPGVHVVVNLRGGFHPMFVEFDEFVVAVDAPAGYPLWDELPASDVAPGPTADWLSERYLGLIRETAPDKPVRHVVLTHHHSDHVGGIRAFVAEGATVLATPPTAQVVRRAAAAPHTVAPDRLARRETGLRLEIVDGSRTITDGTRVLEVIDVGANPHTEHMLVLRLTGEGIWFVSDLLDPVRPDRYPKPEHAALDRWFASWLRAAGHEPERIHTMHGSGLVTPEHLAMLETVDPPPEPAENPP